MHMTTGGLQKELEQLAKSGNDIRDRGAMLDAIRVKVDVFVTSDHHLVDSNPAKKIQIKFGIRILSPSELAHKIGRHIPNYSRASSVTADAERICT